MEKGLARELASGLSLFFLVFLLIYIFKKYYYFTLSYFFFLIFNILIFPCWKLNCVMTLLSRQSQALYYFIFPFFHENVSPLVPNIDRLFSLILI